VQEVPGLDGVIGTRRWMDIFDLVTRLRDRKHPEPLYHLPTDAKVVGLDERGVLRASVQGASAYLKIADGCRRPCAFCAIPKIKGTAVSRPVQNIVGEAVRLQNMGVKELLLIAQDTTDYGYDLGLKDGLAHLLNGIVEAAPDIPCVSWLCDRKPDGDDGKAPPNFALFGYAFATWTPRNPKAHETPRQCGVGV